MAKLTFDWDAKRNVSVAFVPGFRVTVEQDSDARNPWKDMDCLPPLMSYSDRSVTQYGDWSDTGAIAPLPIRLSIGSGASFATFSICRKAKRAT